MNELKLSGSPIVYYAGRGGAEWVLFLHAAYVNHQMFREQIEYFKGKYSILAVDILGHGQSINAAKGDDISKMSRWIKEIMQKEYIDKIHIVGVSLGAVLAQDFANNYPGAVKSLACFGGYDINNFDPAMQKENGAAQLAMMLKAIFSIKWFAKAVKKISAYTPQAQDEFYEMNIRFPKKSFMYLASLNSMVNVHRTGKRDYPLIIGCGEHDVPMELDAVKAWAKNEPDCKTVVFENAGHCANMDAPQAFNNELEKLWKTAQ